MKNEKIKRKMRGEKGFTLVELLLAMAISFVVIGAVYIIYVTSVSAYRVQDMVISLQDRLRFGIEHLKRDISLAGFLATPKWTPNPIAVRDSRICAVNPENNLIAIYFMTGGDVANPSINGTTIMPASVTLFGAYASPSIYLTERIDGQIVYFQNTTEFPFPTREAEYNAIFLNKIGNKPALLNRYLRVVNDVGGEFYFQITGGAFDINNRFVIISQPFPSTGSGPCQIKGFGVGLQANVVSYIRYSLIADSTINPNTNQPYANEGKIDLVREELDINGQTPREGTRLVIVEYVADLNFFDFIFDCGRVGDPRINIYGNCDALTPLNNSYPFVEDVANDYGSGILGRDDNSMTHALRFVTVMLSVRTRDEDPSLPFTPKNHNHDPLDSYELNTEMFGSARVMSLATRVQLKSLTVRNMK